jgi:hypothetical protein
MYDSDHGAAQFVGAPVEDDEESIERGEDDELEA